MPQPERHAGTRRMLALVTDGFGSRGGIGQYNRDLLGALAGSGLFEELQVLARHGDAAQQPLPTGIVQLPPARSRQGFAWQALSLAARRRPQVVFCGHLHLAPLAALLARMQGACLWLQLHGIEAWQPPARLLQAAVRQADLTTCVSRYTRRRFLAWAPLAPHSVKVLPNTVEPRFTPGPPSASLRERLGVQGRRVLLTVSRLAASERYKGHDVVLQALALLLPRHPDLVYVVAGDGDDLPRLRERAQALGVADVVRFAGFVADEELPDLYRSADLFAMPSTGEGFGIVFLQALACGLPVIAGDADGSRDPLRDGAEGELVPASDAQAVARAMDKLLARPRGGTGASRFGQEAFEAQVHRLVALLPPGGRP